MPHWFYLGREGREVDNVDELAGLGQTSPVVAGAIAVCLFSLAGVPPLAGFWGKLAVFAAALDVEPAAGEPGGLRIWFIALAVIGVLNAAMAAAYYLRVVGVMYFRLPLASPKSEGGRGAWIAAIACAVLVVLLGLASGPLFDACRRASPNVSAQANGAATVRERHDWRVSNTAPLRSRLGFSPAAWSSFPSGRWCCKMNVPQTRNPGPRRRPFILCPRNEREPPPWRGS